MKSKYMTFRVTVEEHRKIKSNAAKKSLSMRDFIVQRCANLSDEELLLEAVNSPREEFLKFNNAADVAKAFDIE